MKKWSFFCVLAIISMCFSAVAAEGDRLIVVDKLGNGNFTSINAAINSLPEINIVPTTILIKKGTYEEKVLINRDHVNLIGESRSETKIMFNQLKKDWQEKKDYEGAAVLNITGDDVVIKNLTLQNTMPKVGPTAYVIYSTGTQNIFFNCDILNNGANTVCLMDYKNGRYFLKDCRIEGTVDFLKAMGWCYVENCSFYQREAISSIWHARVGNFDQKMVIKNSSFDGVEHFFLGRSHYDALFFIVGCNFSKNLANKEFYRKTYEEDVEKARNYPDEFGCNYYFSENKQTKTNYKWLKESNLKEYRKKLKAKNLNASFVFGNNWNPERVLNGLAEGSL
ncbi:MAG: pectinesterase family protein [Mangrovibacterium sp.]